MQKFIKVTRFLKKKVIQYLKIFPVFLKLQSAWSHDTSEDTMTFVVKLEADYGRNPFGPSPAVREHHRLQMGFDGTSSRITISKILLFSSAVGT